MNNLYNQPKPAIRTYACRGRATKAQKKALASRSKLLLNPDTRLSHQWSFPLNRKLCVEFGCGAGDSLLYMAQQYPEYGYIGIDVYTPGMGKLLYQIDKLKLANLRLLQADARVALAGCLADCKMALCMVFFPDPWHKTKHHKRRLLNQAFVDLINPSIATGGELWIATDWHNYAEQIIALMASQKNWLPVSSQPLCKRTISTFENKGIKAARQIFEQRWSKLK